MGGASSGRGSSLGGERAPAELTDVTGSTWNASVRSRGAGYGFGVFDHRPVAVQLTPAAWDDEDVQRLAAAQQAELRARYDGGQEPGTPPSAADVAVVLLARDASGQAVACGALRPLGDGAAEVKRMYVVPGARGRGLSKVVLAGLEAAARDRGWTTLRLETGPRQPEAIALYEGAGYRPIPAFGAYADDADDSLFYERVLEPGGQAPRDSATRRIQ
jgi:GNAT superfamily N-acetyltransferase